MFDPAAGDGEHVGTIAEWLRDMTATGQVESLELVCEGQPWFAPWNLVYDARAGRCSVRRRRPLRG